MSLDVIARFGCFMQHSGEAMLFRPGYRRGYRGAWCLMVNETAFTLEVRENLAGRFFQYTLWAEGWSIEFAANITLYSDCTRLYLYYRQTDRNNLRGMLERFCLRYACQRHKIFPLSTERREWREARDRDLLLARLNDVVPNWVWDGTQTIPDCQQ